MKIRVNGIETNYELHGREGAPWLVLSHSLACSVRMSLGRVSKPSAGRPVSDGYEGGSSQANEAGSRCHGKLLDRVR